MKRLGKSITPTIRILILALPFVFGCASKLDPDYEAPSGELHPFTETAEHTEHGAYLAEEGYDFSLCTGCHGEDLAGQQSGEDGGTVRSCYQCHTAENHIVGFATAAEHAQYLRGQDWDLDRCFVCHYQYGNPEGVHFGGSCSSTGCHSDAGMGPGACNTCHGAFSGDYADTLAWAPPEDLSGNTDTSYPGVGAHQVHLLSVRDFAAPVPCSACHHVPETWNAPAHIDDDPDEVGIVWGFPANARGADPEYHDETLTCSSTHCHGEARPVWTELDGSWSSCGSCHGLPPDFPHPSGTISQCADCHGEVIDITGTIVAPHRHVNGVVDLDFGG